MRAIIAFIAVLCAAAGYSQTASGYQAGSAYNKLWIASKVTTINGTVTGRLVSPPSKGMENSVALMVKQPEKEPYEVQLGPHWFVSRMPAQINVGDKVTVSGSQVTLDGRSVIMAESVTKGSTEVLFRNRSGTPRWIGLVAEPAPTNVQLENGTLVATNTVTINGVEHQLYRIETEQGMIDIVGAPTWYTNRQDYRLEIGGNVQIIGAMRPVPIGVNLFWADNLYTSGNTILLRPFGF